MKVGVLGGGQLGRMLALAGIPLGVDFRFLDERRDVPAGCVGELFVGAYDDHQLLREFAAGIDVVTYEFENIPVDSVRWLIQHVSVSPPPRALAAAQDRLTEKNLFRDLGIATPEYAAIDDRDDLEAAVTRLGLPLILKTRRGGYDGKGQFRLAHRRDVPQAWEELGATALVAETVVPFTRELSLIGVRNFSGACACYPLVENIHVGGILDTTIAPAADVPTSLAEQAEAWLRRLLDALEYVGVLSIELFECEGRLLANEMAPRVHNSGHWTIEGAPCSQFENHVRAICGWPLGPTQAHGTSIMLNLIGALPATPLLLEVPGVHTHLYGKQPRPGRKLGHVTVHMSSREETQRQADVVRRARRNQH